MGLYTVYMKRLLPVLLGLLLVTGCVPRSFIPVCRHYALFHAVTVSDHYPVRIAVGPSIHPDSKGIYHAQVQFKKDGEWYYVSSDYVVVYETSQDPFAPETYYTIKEFLKLIHKGK